MLLELKVKDLGIIADIDWKLEAGFSVITGETGAGKSLIIDAVELLLAGAAGGDFIREGAIQAGVEGVFTLAEDERFSPLKALLADKGLSGDEDALVISFGLRKQKPGLVRINGHAVTKNILRQIGRLLIDIHGQSEHLSLLDNKYHLDFLDAYASTSELRKNLAAGVTRLYQTDSAIKSLQSRESETSRQLEFLKFQVDEIKRAQLREGEDEELENERSLISFSRKLKEYSSRTYQSLRESDSSSSSFSALAGLNEAIRAMKKLVEIDPSMDPQLDYLQKMAYGLEETARDVLSYHERLEFDPGRLEEIELRLELIRSLKRKYGNTITEILGYLSRSEDELDGLGLCSEKRIQLENERSMLKSEIGKLASELSKQRLQASRRLVLEVRKELQDLEMPQMDFQVSITQASSSEGIEGPDLKTYAFNRDGIDKVEFMVSTNPGEPLKPLARVASTGEMSRFSLALKGALSEADNIPTLIFDERETGVGGRSGDVIGRKLWALARNHQVVCITHLPQIAAYADAHYCVRKEVSGSRAVSTLEVLEGPSRFKELASMLAGPAYTETALKSIAELMLKADSWKKARGK